MMKRKKMVCHRNNNDTNDSSNHHMKRKQRHYYYNNNNNNNNNQQLLYILSIVAIIFALFISPTYSQVVEEEKRPQPPSLHSPASPNTPGMTKNRPVGVRLKPQARKTTTRHVSSVSSRTEHRHPPRAHRHDRRAEIGRGTPV